MLRRGRGAGPSCYPGLWGWLWQSQGQPRRPRCRVTLDHSRAPQSEIYPHGKDERWTAGVFTHTLHACGNVSEDAWGPPSTDSLRLVCRSKDKTGSPTRAAGAKANRAAHKAS